MKFSLPEAVTMIRQLEAIRKVLKSNAPDIVIHLAACVGGIGAIEPILLNSSRTT